MAITNGRVEGLITVPTGGWAGTVDDGGGADAFTIAAGPYYMASSAGSTSFIAAVEAALETATGAGFTVSIADGEGGTGLVTIAKNSGTFTLSWPIDNLMRALLGFTADLTPTAASFVGTRQARSIWMPDCPQVGPYDSGDAGTDVSANAQMVSPSGHVTGKRTTRLQWSWRRWDACSGPKVRTASQTTQNTAFQGFWRDHVEGTAGWAAAPFGPIRIYGSADDDATFTTYKVSGDLARTFEPRQVQEGWTGLWQVAFDKLYVVPS